MKKLLYITVNTRPEEMSSSKTVGRKLANSILEKHTDMVLEELDLYKEHIPQLKSCYFQSRSTIANAEALMKLSNEEQQEVRQILRLCDQFIEADIYLLAAPMWSLSFPAPLLEYIDCVVLGDKTIAFEDKKPHGLLNDKERIFIYVQSSGANIPWIIRPALNKGLNYVHDIMKFIGISKFEELLVDGTGTTEIERLEAIEKAEAKIASLVEQIRF
ncbi:FMN-dependent NADH-azoreductase [Ruminiclostridium sufflavum DSM 19573]|uniref:FMN-dependent NADH-azoreductase n=1 Tax=Ruminiclostridium sufflavum DSM 19573 TaxID=1121337 RepID=A0A318XRJ8_9FIRM|nr:NAD(P)H-dependent oxidoreductase [Ruminiclostridium sufflavum]PYG89953.1 FMN-dependent NADH-azoreductase [Ruminiclostridium sufflavum DSM 19573]